MTTPLSSFFKQTLFFRNPNSIILLTPIPSSQKVGQHMRKLLAHAATEPAEGHEFETLGAKVLFVDPELALQALDALNADPKDPRNIHEYQQRFIDSNLEPIHAAISGILAKSPMNVRTGTASTLIRMALEACRETIMRAEWDVDVVCSRVSELRSKVEVAKARARAEVLGAEGTDEVKNAMTQATKEMKGVMGELTWWRMLWRIDDISEIVGNAVRKIWCRDLEDKVRSLPPIIRVPWLMQKYNLAHFPYRSPFCPTEHINILCHAPPSPSPLARPAKYPLPTHLITIIPPPKFNPNNTPPNASKPVDQLPYHTPASRRSELLVGYIRRCGWRFGDRCIFIGCRE
jgi:hypothetical protein